MLRGKRNSLRIIKLFFNLELTVACFYELSFEFHTQNEVKLNFLETFVKKKLYKRVKIQMSWLYFNPK